MSFTPDVSGWYIPLPLPLPPLPPPSIVYPEQGHTATVRQIEIHDVWQGRLAPFPGFTSQPGLFPVNKHQPVNINSPPNHLPKLQLLPPRSMASTNININMHSFSPEFKPEDNKVSLLSPSISLFSWYPQIHIFQFDKYVSPPHPFRDPLF